MKHLLIAATLVLLAGLAGPTVEAIDCPEEFSECSNQTGKKCTLGTGSQCDITDLEVQSCTIPGQDPFTCPQGQTVATKDCPCNTRLQWTCCDDTCSCGSCEEQAGSRELICVGIICQQECPLTYCTGEGTGCTWVDCGAGGCCQYSCGSMPSCTGPDPCPNNTCPGSCQ
jgi:hypothetical protein